MVWLTLRRLALSPRLDMWSLVIISSFNVCGSTFFTTAVLFLWLIGLTSRIKKTFFGLIRKIPFVGGAVSISGDFVPSFLSQSAVTLLSEALMSHPWITAAWGWVRPLAHLTSCSGDNSWLLQAIMSPRDVSLSGFMKNVQKEFTAALYESFYCSQRQLMSKHMHKLLVCGRFRVSSTRLWTTCRPVCVI